MPTKTVAAAPKVPKEKVTVAAASASQAGVAASNVDQKQVLKAFKALSAHVARHRKAASTSASSSALPLDGPQGNLRDPTNSVYLQITINTLNPVSKVKPVRINLPHALHEPGEASVCLLVKDPQREYKDVLVQDRVKCIARVVGVAKLKGKFKPFEARRALVQDHDMFLADQRIVPTLPNLCGKVFFDAKKHPITVNVQKKGVALKEELEAAIRATTYLQNKGSCTSVKIGYMASHTAEQLTDNLMSALPAIVTRLKGGWENVHNIDVKTGNSAALPIWNQQLGLKTHVTSIELLQTADSSTANPTSSSSATKSKRHRPLADPSTHAVETPSKKLAKAPVVASDPSTPSASPAVKNVNQSKAQPAPVSPKKPSPRKTRSAAAAKAKASNSILHAAAAAPTPTKTPSATPKKSASSLTRSAKKAK